MTDIKIHPAAECVRLMDDEELAALATDIGERGQIDPIVMGRINGADTEALVDGRNRLRACELAGVQPRFDTIMFASDDEVRAFINSREQRRSLNKGQQAMRLALLYPQAEQGGRGKKDQARKSTEAGGFSYRRVQDARTVLHHSRELALAVRDGTKPLDEALAEVTASRKNMESAEAQMARLRAEAPDQADLVAEGRLKIIDGIRVLEGRIADQQRVERTATDLLRSIVNMLHPRGADPTEWAARLIKDVNPKYWPSEDQGPALTRANVENAARVLTAIAELRSWEKR